jgi:hypothetical protein
MKSIKEATSLARRSQLTFEFDNSPLTCISYQKFKCFSKLPTELRIAVWRLALPGPRILDIFKVKDDCDKSWDHGFTRYKSFRLSPTLLAVCHESRKVTLKSYTVTLAPHGFSLAFNPDIDIIHVFGGILGTLNQDIFTQDAFGGCGPTIQRVAIDESMLSAFREDTPKAERAAIGWLSLKEIFIILSPATSLKWPYCLNSERTKFLSFDSPVVQEDGWGNAVLQNQFTKLLLKARQTLVSGHRLAGDAQLPETPKPDEEVKLPTVKVVQWGTMDNKDDPFCVPVTGGL